MVPKPRCNRGGIVAAYTYRVGTMKSRHPAAQPREDEVADLQRLISYVEHWLVAHTQVSDAPSGDRRLGDADALLRKLHNGLQLATSQGPGFRPGTAGNGQLYLH